MTDEQAALVAEITRLTSVIATKRVRRFAVLQPNYRGNENVERLEAQLVELQKAQRAALEALCASKS